MIAQDFIEELDKAEWQIWRQIETISNETLKAIFEKLKKEYKKSLEENGWDEK